MKHPPKRNAKTAAARGEVPSKARAPKRGARDAWAILDRPQIAIPLAMLVAAIVHAPALRMFFAQDDVTFLARARGLSPTPWSLARPLSEGWVWRGLQSMFGLEPLPYHLFNFGLHLANVALVYLIGRRILGVSRPALAAAILFGASSIAFTPLHWTSCLVELLVTTFSLASFALWLHARSPAAEGVASRAPLLWIAALLGLAALLSKESAILFPAVLVVAHLRFAPRASGRPWLPQAIVTLGYAVAFLATLKRVHYIGSEAYSMTASAPFLFQNAATYASWSVAIWDPVRDAVAAMNPAAWPIGLAVIAAAAIALWAQRREASHPAEIGAAWLAAFLLPVVPLLHHTYLYYLYLPWAGACWLLAASGARLARNRPAVGVILAVLVVAFAGVEAANVRAREKRAIGSFLQDKTMREELLLRNVVRGLREAKLTSGDRLVFVNPAPRRHTALTADAAADTALHSYVPLEGAMRGGETIRLFFPGVEYLGFGTALRPEWEDARAFLFQDDGRVRDLGIGGRSLAELGYFTLRLERWGDAEQLFLRSRARGDTLPEATFGLIVTSGKLGRPEESRRYAEEFLRRWPNDPRAAVVAQGLR